MRPIPTGPTLAGAAPQAVKKQQLSEAVAPARQPGPAAGDSRGDSRGRAQRLTRQGRGTDSGGGPQEVAYRRHGAGNRPARIPATSPGALEAARGQVPGPDTGRDRR